MFTNRSFYLLMMIVLLVITACTPQVAATSEATSAPVVTTAPAEPITLRLAVADPTGVPSEPYALEFIEQVKTLSNGDITIEPTWEAGDSTEAGFETGVIQLVKDGKYDLGLAASRAFDNENIPSFQALQAPFLIDNDALSKAVATSDIAVRMLDNLSPAGIVGLTLWPEDLRHPFSLVPGKPFLAPEDFAGLNIRATRSRLTYTMIETLGGKPMFGDGGYEGAESGLRQGASLTGTPIATGNVNFFAKFQVLFANGLAFEKLSDAQRAILRQAALATQKKAIAEHPSEVEAGTAWCADGGSIVLASDAQVEAFEKAAQPIFDSIAQDPLNVDFITAIRELKAKTEPSPGAEACTPAPATTMDSGDIPPELIGTWSFTAFGESWQAELKDTGTFSLYGPDGQFDVGGSYSILGNEAVFRDEIRGTGTLCFPPEGRYHWEMSGDRLMFTVIEDKCAVGRIEQWTAGWQKVEEEWSTGWPPNGVWRVELTADDFIKMGTLNSTADDMAGIYTWTFRDGQAKIEIHGSEITVSCMVVATVVGDAVRLQNVASPDCDGNAYDDVQWRLDADGLHFHLVSSQAVELKTMYESKPWQKVADQ